MCLEINMVNTVCSYVFLGNLVVHAVFSYTISDQIEELKLSDIKNETDAGISISADDYELPDQWRSFCHVSDDVYKSKYSWETTKLVSIRCNVHSEHSGVWKMEDLRESLKKYNDSNTRFSVNLQCQTMSYISLSLPFNVYNLFQLEVNNCAISDFFMAYLNSFEDTPDSIYVLQLTNCVIFPDWIRTSFAIVPMKGLCIHKKTIESFTFTNITSSYYEGPINDEFLHDTLFRFVFEFFQSKCRYDNLKTLNRSQTTGWFSNFIDLVVMSGDFPSLITYNMSYTQIKFLNRLQRDWFNRFIQIETFDLSHNNFSTVYFYESDLYRRRRSQCTINLQYNNISSLPVLGLENEFMFIDLRNNPLNCSCSDPLTDLITHIRNGNHLKTRYAYIGELQCHGPASVAGKPLKSLTSDMVCIPVLQTENFLVPIYIFSAVFIILIIVFIILVKFRLEISIILFSRFNIVVPCQKRENNDADKIYDAFVSYSSSEDDFVENFFTDLENTTGFKLCMHHRDFIPGKTIFDNVTHSIESSRHTIILISNHFIESEFCLYEFQEAFRQSIMEKRRHLVIVMLEEILEAKLPRDLRRCVKTFTYIRKDDYLLKERLIYALSVKHKDRTVHKKTKSKEDGNSESRL